MGIQLKRQDKVVYYYGINIINTITKVDETDKVKDIFKDIFSKNCIKNNPPSIFLGSNGEHLTMDIIIDNDTYLFARVGKVKPNADMQLRNFKTGERKDVLTEKQLEEMGVEICTYFLLDYKKGIVGFIFGKSAPSVEVIKKILSEYTKEYEMEITSISSPDSVKALLNPGSEIKRITYKCLIPDPSVLSDIGLDRDVIAELGDSRDKEVVLTIKCIDNKPITKAQEKIVLLLEGLKKNKDKISNVSVTGKTPTSITKNYSFDENFLSFKIKFPIEENDSGIVRALTPAKLSEIVYEKMALVYQENRKLLLLLSNRDE